MKTEKELLQQQTRAQHRYDNALRVVVNRVPGVEHRRQQAFAHVLYCEMILRWSNEELGARRRGIN